MLSSVFYYKWNCQSVSYFLGYTQSYFRDFHSSIKLPLEESTEEGCWAPLGLLCCLKLEHSLLPTLVFGRSPAWCSLSFLLWCLTLICGNSESLFFQMFLLSLSLFLLLLIFLLSVCYTFCSYPKVLGYSVLVSFSPVFVLFAFWFYWYIL